MSDHLVGSLVPQDEQEGKGAIARASWFRKLQTNILQMIRGKARADKCINRQEINK